MSKRVIAFALAIFAFFIFIGSPFEQAANAIAGVDDALIAILIAALAAVGITFVTTGAFQSTQEYVENLLSQYASFRGTTVPGLFQGVDSGVNKKGHILMNNRFVVLLEGFAYWLIAELGLQNNTTMQLQQGGYFVGDFIAYKLPIFTSRYNPSLTTKVIENLFTGGAEVYCILVFKQLTNNASYFSYVMVSDMPSYVIYNWARYSNQAATNLQSEGSQVFVLSKEDYESARLNIVNAQQYFAVINSAENMNSPTVSNWQINIDNPVYYDPDEISQALSGTLADLVQQDAIEVVVGDVLLPSDNSDYSEGDGAILDVGAQWGDGYADVTGTVIPGAFDDSGIADPSITYDAEEVVEEQVEESQSEAQQISQDIADYRVAGLESVFPFCIPFDIYDMLSALNAPAEAPVIYWRFYVPGIIDETLEIDLSVFDSVAAILRTMELLAFIVGLAYVTREKFIRG